MEVTHGIALLFAISLVVIAAIFNKMLWWLLCIGYIFAVSYMAIVNEWELLFYPVLVITGIISIIGFGYSAARGEIV